MTDSSPTDNKTAAEAVLTELAVVRRSDLIESGHFGTLVALDSTGRPVLELGA